MYFTLERIDILPCYDVDTFVKSYDVAHFFINASLFIMINQNINKFPLKDQFT